MRLRFLILAAALAIAPSALAKGPDTARICGETCVTVSGPEKVNVLALWTSGFAARAEPPEAPFFNVTLTSSLRPDDESWLFVYVPSAKALKIVRADFSGGIAGVKPQGAWASPSAEVLAAYNSATTGLEPLPANRDWAVPAGDETWPWWTFALIAGGITALLLLISRRLVWRRVARSRLSI